MKDLSSSGKKIKVVNKFFIFLGVSLAIILAGLLVTIFKGLNIGIDFSSGAEIDVTVTDENGINDAEFEKFVNSWLAGERQDGTKGDQFEVAATPRISTTPGKRTYEFRITDKMKKADGTAVDMSAIITDQESEYYNKKLLASTVNQLASDIREPIEDYFKTNVAAFSGKTETELAEMIEINYSTTDNSVMLYTVRTAFIAAAVAILVMLIYIMFRFTWISGLAAILALLHDVLIMVSFMAFTGTAINSVFIAAVITIIGYSINATIIVFDRIRELLKTPSYNDMSDAEIADEAISHTIKRSILTTVTTLVVIVLLAILAPSSIREFAYPIIFGLIAGAYSSIFLSAPIWVYLRKLFKQSGKRPNVKKSKKSSAVAEAQGV